MANYNRVILAGNLTRDPELSYTASNTPVCKLGMAINRRWRDRNSNELREETCFVDCTAFARSAETINQYMKKGQSILIEGRLSYSSWQAQDGSKRSKLEVIVETFQFLGGPGGGQNTGSRGGAPAREPQSRPAPQAADDMDNYGPPPGGDEVPF